MLPIDRIASASFLALVVTVPVIFVDLFPFSAFPMYSDNRDRHRFFEIVDGDGIARAALDYGLVEVTTGNRDQRYGIKLPPLFFDEYDVPSRDNVVAFLNAHYMHNDYPIHVSLYELSFDASQRRMVRQRADSIFIDREDDRLILEVTES